MRGAELTRLYLSQSQLTALPTEIGQLSDLLFFRQLSKFKLTYTFITTRRFSLFLQIAMLEEQLSLTGRNWCIVFYHS
ncbi:hypothetical protein DB42_DZ00010 [Neochlamydia sp. EPS4]|uniref:hypothetical protein n=1 Tax=Neochlamydia sp. EPS4 TaxID=1478175 RepID=UPI000582EB23|nr:hypothetical protein [Neochlamydia sp. EPS4]KIC76285.1 hypothetical protein DB42_DZ00010 [Neochlamydia sp. EPS4]